jgi:hypothetical protein
MAHATLSNVGYHVVPKAGTVPLANAAGTRYGAAIDARGYGSLVLLAQVGAATGTPTSYTADFSLEESADGTNNWTAVTGSGVTQITADDKLERKDFDCAKLSKAYVRVKEVIAITGGTTPKVPASSCVLLGGGHYPPA